MNEAEQLIRLLERNRQKLVLAESCTGGLIAAELAKVPGVSNWLCGSAVTYRSETKTAWLDVDAAVIQRQTAVCTEVAGQMVQGILQITPEADIAAAITGHLGPGAPADLDGVVFIATALRRETSPTISRHQLMSAERIDRQSEAAKLLLAQVAAALMER